MMADAMMADAMMADAMVAHFYRYLTGKLTSELRTKQTKKKILL